MNALAAVYRVEASTPLLEGYWLALKDLGVERIDMAAQRWLVSGKRMPSPAELRELSGEVPIAARAVKAWAKVKESIRKFGAYRSVNFDDCTVNATIRTLGGWERLCSYDSEELDKWTRKEFERIYVALATSGVSEEEGRYLPGITEQQAAFDGYASPQLQPVTIATGLGATVNRAAMPSASLGGVDERTKQIVGMALKNSEAA